MTYPHLHAHTEVSLLDGLRQVELSVSLAARRGIPTLACTDHGTIASAPQFHAACRLYGVKPIIGLEAYFVNDRHEKERKHFGHLTLLARTHQGYRNLIKLVTASNTDGYYYRPRVDWDLLERHCDGLIALSGCAGGILPRALEAGIGREVLDRLIGVFGQANVFGEVMYLDVMPPGLNDAVRDISASYGLKVVATNDAHYPLPEDADVHPLLVAMATKSYYGDPQAFKIDSRELYLKSRDEMERHGVRDGTARETVLREMAAAVDLAGEIDDYEVRSTAAIPVPPQWRGEDPNTVLRQLTLAGLTARGVRDAEHEAQAGYELDIICSKGFARYFLVLAEMYGWIAERGITVGPGRGSAAASTVLYALGATGLDPLQYPRMRFDRFLNPERIDDPDVDCDIASHRRGEVIQHLADVYGTEHVVHLGTFSTYAPKSLFNDLARTLRATDLRINFDLPTTVWINYVYEAAAARSEGREPLILYEDLKRFLAEINLKLGELESRTGLPVRRAFEAISGQARHLGTHASAIILAEEPVGDVAPVVRVGQSLAVGFTEGVYRKVLSKTGLLKLDVLGLSALELLEHASELTGGEPIRFDNVSYDDPKVFKAFADGYSAGIFQFESSASIRMYASQLHPTEFSDLYSILALWRPGPLDSGMAMEYLKLKAAGPRKLHPIVDEVLGPSYGMMIFQEDLIRLYSAVSGATAGQADLLRRDLIKRTKDEGHDARIETARERWFTGGRERGVTESVLKRLWDEMMTFARYGFNAPHAISYAAIAYRMMSFKVHHPAEFIAAALPDAFAKDKAQGYIAEARRLGVRVLPPHVNSSRQLPVAIGRDVRLHLSTVKGVGERAALELIEHAPYTGVADLRERTTKRVVNRGVLKALVQVGALDDLDGLPELLTELELELDGDVTARRVQLLGVLLPDSKGSVMNEPDADLIKRAHRVGEREICAGGVLLSARVLKTRRGDAMALLIFEAPTGEQWQLVCWPPVWAQAKDFLKPGAVILAKGRRDPDAERKFFALTLALLDGRGGIARGVKDLEGGARRDRFGTKNVRAAQGGGGG